MTNFSDLNIAPQIKVFVGEKIPIKKVVGQSINVLDFDIRPSKTKEGTDCLYLQIEKSGEKRVIFSGSKVLMDQIQRVPEGKFPFSTVIRENDYYEFT